MSLGGLPDSDERAWLVGASLCLALSLLCVALSLRLTQPGLVAPAVFLASLPSVP